MAQVFSPKLVQKRRPLAWYVQRETTAATTTTKKLGNVDKDKSADKGNLAPRHRGKSTSRVPTKKRKNQQRPGRTKWQHKHEQVDSRSIGRREPKHRKEEKNPTTKTVDKKFNDGASVLFSSVHLWRIRGALANLGENKKECTKRKVQRTFQSHEPYRILFREPGYRARRGAEGGLSRKTVRRNFCLNKNKREREK